MLQKPLLRPDKKHKQNLLLEKMKYLERLNHIIVTKQISSE